MVGGENRGVERRGGVRGGVSGDLQRRSLVAADVSRLKLHLWNQARADSRPLLLVTCSSRHPSALTPLRSSVAADVNRRMNR